MKRDASRASAGAARVGVDLVLANVLTTLAARYVPEPLMEDVESLVVGGVAMAFAYLGKRLRDAEQWLGEML